MLAILISILIIVSVIIIIIIIIFIYHDALGDSCLEFIQGSAELADSHTFLNTHHHNSYSLLNASLFQALDMFCLSPPQNKPMRSALSHLPFYQWGL